MSDTGICFRHTDSGRVCALRQQEPRRFAWVVTDFGVDGDDAVGHICAEWHNTDEGRVINGKAT